MVGLPISAMPGSGYRGRVAETSGDRSSHFPAIERKHGRPVEEWLEELAALGDVSYREQMSLLQDVHGFSRAHANALVMYARGSTSARRFDDPEAFFRDLGGEREQTARAIISTILDEFPDLELVIAWNQPMLRRGTDYVFGLSAATNHLLIASWGGISETVAAQLGNLTVNKKTIRVPVDWDIDSNLLRVMVAERLAQLQS
jgi:uncharacterized protein YdhG (YjbR/CyaY superfamily)